MAAPRKRYTPRKAVAAKAGLPAIVPAAVAPVMTPKADFQQGTDGRGPRLAWARYPAFGFGGGTGFGGSPLALTMGGRVARDAGKAANVANEISTSNPAVATIVETSETNAVGVGLTLSSKPDAEALGMTPEQVRALSHAIETKWQAWAANPLEVDVSGRHDLHSLAGGFYRSAMLNGEGLATLDWQRFPGARTRTKVALLDVAQLDATRTGVFDNWRTLNGVAFNERGRVAGYWLRRLPLGSVTAAPISQFERAYTSWGRQRVIHLFELKDARQVRGLSPMVAALTPAHERESLGEFTLDNALLQSMFALTITSELPQQAAFNSLAVNDDASGMGDDPLKSREDWYSKAKISPQPGVINHLHPGDKLNFNSVDNPSSTFDAFDRSLVRKAARAAGESYENVSGDYSQTNFSASRMAGEQPHRTTMRRRRVLVEQFYQAVFAAWLEEMIETGEIELPADAPNFNDAKQAYCAAAWLGWGRAEPDRKKAADATILELENGLSTLESALAERGIDLETHIANLKAERDLLRAAGLDHPFFVGQTTTQVREQEPPTPANDPVPPTRRKRK